MNVRIIKTSREYKTFVRLSKKVGLYVRNKMSPPVDLESEYMTSLDNYRFLLDSMNIFMPRKNKTLIKDHLNG